MSTCQATWFRCDEPAVRKTGNQLARVAKEMQDFNLHDDVAEYGLHSATISKAIDDFQDDSSDFREKTQQAIESLGAILLCLADGVKSRDDALYKAFSPQIETVPYNPGHGAVIRPATTTTASFVTTSITTSEADETTTTTTTTTSTTTTVTTPEVPSALKGVK